LTDFGRSVTGHYRAIEAATQTAGRSHIAALAVALAEIPPAASRNQSKNHHHRLPLN
jgi:hypothetical protein